MTDSIKKYALQFISKKYSCSQKDIKIFDTPAQHVYKFFIKKDESIKYIEIYEDNDTNAIRFKILRESTFLELCEYYKKQTLIKKAEQNRKNGWRDYILGKTDKIPEAYDPREYEALDNEQINYFNA